MLSRLSCTYQVKCRLPWSAHTQLLSPQTIMQHQTGGRRLQRNEFLFNCSCLIISQEQSHKDGALHQPGTCWERFSGKIIAGKTQCPAPGPTEPGQQGGQEAAAPLQPESTELSRAADGCVSITALKQIKIRFRGELQQGKAGAHVTWGGKQLQWGCAEPKRFSRSGTGTQIQFTGVSMLSQI